MKPYLLFRRIPLFRQRGGGVDWFLERVMPGVSPDIDFRVVGTICDALRDRTLPPNVYLEGRVEHLTPGMPTQWLWCPHIYRFRYENQDNRSPEVRSSCAGYERSFLWVCRRRCSPDRGILLFGFRFLIRNQQTAGGLPCP